MTTACSSSSSAARNRPSAFARTRTSRASRRRCPTERPRAWAVSSSSEEIPLCWRASCTASRPRADSQCSREPAVALRNSRRTSGQLAAGVGSSPGHARKPSDCGARMTQVRRHWPRSNRPGRARGLLATRLEPGRLKPGIARLLAPPRHPFEGQAKADQETLPLPARAPRSSCVCDRG